MVKNPPANAGDTTNSDLILGVGRSHGIGNGNLLQYSCMKNSMDRRAWQAIVHGVKKCRTKLNNCANAHTHTYTQGMSIFKRMVYIIIRRLY